MKYTFFILEPSEKWNYENNSIYKSIKKNIKYLGLYWPKSIHLYFEKHKTLWKDIREDLSKWKNIAYSWIKDNIIKILLLSKLIYKFNAILIRIPANCFVEIDKMILKFIENCKRPRTDKTILQKYKIWGLNPVSFKIKIVKNDQDLQINRMELRVQKKKIHVSVVKLAFNGWKNNHFNKGC
jgi:hypothetical protein